MTAVTRRAFLRNGTLVLLASGSGLAQAARLLADSPDAKPLVRAGVVTDLHYADKPTRGTRYYRETLAKLEEAGQQFEQQKPDFIVELGDFIDSAGSVEAELAHLRRIHKQFAELPGKKHYVLGNHCVETLTKEEFLGQVEQPSAHYAFDQGGVHFVVLDACYRSDGQPYGRKNSNWTDANIPAAEIEWLEADLKAADKPVIVLAHQRLDNSGVHAVKNAAQVRKVLEASGKVAAVFQGHSHKNDYQQIAGIHYCTLVAMVEGAPPENSGYAVLDVFPGGDIRLTGFRKQGSYRWQ